MSFSYIENEKIAKIKVIGVGGAGGNAVNNMIDANLQGVKFIVANTDAQALDISRAEHKIQLGSHLTQGLGAGANPEVGKDAAYENIEEIRTAISGSHMVFITAGFGGGTGTGAAPVIAEVCRELGILTVAVVSKPFSFEGTKRFQQAEAGVDNLRSITDTVITIPNDRLRSIASKDAKMIDMFIKADEILHHSVKGITDLIMVPGLVNLDFADVRTIMSKAGMALMGIGIASGNNRATEAAERAISHPLLEDIPISGSRGVLINITSSSDLTLDEMTEASDRIHQEAGDDAEIIWGQSIDENLGEEMRVTVIATGIGQQENIQQENIHRFNTIKSKNRNLNTIINSKQQHHGSVETRDITKGKIRDASNKDIEKFEKAKEEFDILTQKQIIGQDARNSYRGTIDNENLDIPTFLRRKAD